MHARHPCFEGGRLPRLEPILGLITLIPRRDVAGHVPRPRAGIGRLQRQPPPLFALADLLLRLSALRGVLHGADHPHGVAAGLPGNVAAVFNFRVRSILAAEAILVGPVILPRVNRRLDARLDAVEVFGVDALLPRLAVRLHFLRPVAEECLEVLVPPEGIGLEVPIPDGVERGAIGQLETLEALPQPLRRCCPFPVELDVLLPPEQAHAGARAQQQCAHEQDGQPQPLAQRRIHFRRVHAGDH